MYRFQEGQAELSFLHTLRSVPVYCAYELHEIKSWGHLVYTAGSFHNRVIPVTIDYILILRAYANDTPTTVQ